MANASLSKKEPEKEPEIPETGEYSLTVPIQDIHVDPKINIRKEYNPSAMNRLAESLSKRGQFQSILVTPKSSWWSGGPNGEPWLLIQGSRRYFSAQEAKKTSLIVIVKSFKTLEDALAANMEENIQHESISFYESLMRVKQFAMNSKLMGDPGKVASEESIGLVASEISTKCGAPLDFCESMVGLAELVAPEILEKLKYDETDAQLDRVESCKHIGDDSLSRREKYDKQLDWWKREGWNKPRSAWTKKSHGAKPAEILDMASRIRAAKGLKGPSGAWIDLHGAQLEAVCMALEWCAAPKGKQSPL